MVARQDAVASFEAIPAMPQYRTVDDHPFYGAFGRRYYPAVARDQDEDVSFMVMDGDEALIYLPAMINDGVLNYNGMPLRFFFREGLEPTMESSAIAHALTHIELLVQKHAVQCIRIADQAAAQLTQLGQACLGRNYALSLQLSGLCDLSIGEAGLRRHLRKSFRSLINWGRSNLVLSYVNSGNPDHEQFLEYQDFHRRISGRSTRQQKSWDAMFSALIEFGGELALARLSTGELVAGNLVVDGKTTSYYASGVYDRERFDKPMAHWPLWNAINRSRERGMRWFDLGYTHMQGSVEAKEYAIGYFKRGFATAIASSLEWRQLRAPANVSG